MRKIPHPICWGAARPDKETAERWVKYLAIKDRKQPFLAKWDKEKSPEAAREFQALLLDINKEKKRVDEENHIRLGLNPSRENLWTPTLSRWRATNMCFGRNFRRKG